MSKSTESTQNSDARNEILSFTVAGQTLALPILSVQEVRSFEAPTPMPGMRDGFMGILNLRGQMVPVFDVARKLSLGALEPTTNSIIVVVQAGGRTNGLAVDAVNDVLAYTAENYRDPAKLGGVSLTAYVLGILDFNGRIVQLLDCEKALGLEPQENFETVPAELLAA